ncbi:MAG: D-aminoacyl-tRNA deacylase [Nitrospirales bacterium]|nr:D-aminoacyl-tRNA deacylase [Nitrospirales bacterium]
MIAVLQRVREASVTVRDTTIARIAEGLLVLLGVAVNDSDQDVAFIVDKIQHLRLFSDEAGKMNYSLQDIQGELLIVSQFTLLGNTGKGRRPSFEQAALPNEARTRYQQVVNALQKSSIPVQTGIFGENMLVSIKNDGPVTMLLDSRGKNTVHR